MKIHHLGIVTSDVDETLLALGLDRASIAETIFDSHQKNNLYFIHLPENDMWLELVEPVSDDASTARFAKKYGMGLHHLAMDSNNLENTESVHAARPGNFVLGRYAIDVPSFGGDIKTLFVAVKGLILEFVKVGK